MQLGFRDAISESDSENTQDNRDTWAGEEPSDDPHQTHVPPSGGHGTRVEGDFPEDSPSGGTVHQAPEEIAAWTVFLASDFGEYITGQVIHVDGGLKMP